MTPCFEQNPSQAQDHALNILRDKFFVYSEMVTYLFEHCLDHVAVVGAHVQEAQTHHGRSLHQYGDLQVGRA